MKCPYCGSKNTTVYYSARMPLTLSACSKKLMNISKNKLIEASICRDCFLGFNSCRLTKEELNEIYNNYYYISPMSGIGETKYIGMLDTLNRYFDKNDKIMEIGCSEGYLLKKLENLGYDNLIGIEPGPQANDAEKLGLNIIKGYFSEKTISQKYDGFYLMHVFEHFLDPFTILKSMKNLLSEKGKIIIEVPNFNGYHHQHLFFYNIYFIDRMCRDNNLKIIEYNIAKGALRVVIIKKENTCFSGISYNFSTNEFIKNLCVYNKNFNDKVKKINEILRNNKKIYWWGAGSSSVIYLNQLENISNYNHDIVVVDGDKNKVGLYIPGVDLKVNSFRILENKDINMLVIASSFYKEIKNTINNFNINVNHIEIVY
ncbi:methyltransferase domain-containing protein [Clostridium tyrobutyricum]|uniref:methyltransferase domain-containing protein n=1 Tax=Clostridium tyrobutyricum TaxID=1519 RepID=UPI001C386F1E|nr:methyltransferase domain-containing protein [Clostridium tyrobutyricum]MBV4430575.1 methyltransferase domain-containing protein [Clostridium tyrobutyricum]MBV4437214.1 methyltransferase domain-containing protein [Clostridium tyrobutyricum]